MGYWYSKEPNYYSPQIGFSFFPIQKSWGRYYYFFLIGLSGFKKSKWPKPLKSKIRLEIQIFFCRFTFRIGIQHRTWFHITSEEFNDWLYKLKNKNETPF